MSDKENSMLVATDAGGSEKNSVPITDRSAFKTRLARFSYLASTTSEGSDPSVNGTSSENEARSQTAHAMSDDLAESVVRRYTSSRGYSNRKNSRSTASDVEPKITKVRKSKSKLRSVSGLSRPPANRIHNNLVDSLSPNLTLVMCGVNPGLETARTGHAYAHPSNRYWPTMYEAGITPIRHHPSETHTLQELYGIGHTNIVTHPTRTEAEITRQEYLEGAAELEAKIRRFRPLAIAIVGKGIWDTWVEYKTGARTTTASGQRRLRELELSDRFEYGWQDERLWVGRMTGIDDDGTEEVSWKGAMTIVVTTTSGAAAQFARNGGAERLRLWRPLGEWFEPYREEWVKRREEREGEGRDGVKVEDDDGSGVVLSHSTVIKQEREKTPGTVDET